tara:strand:+ start:5834 stop:7069 length:1236 start_codon:yes stop_codon:yes gene_type:complete
MKILFVHQNFPGQFIHLSKALVKQRHDVYAVRVGDRKPYEFGGVKVFPYKVSILSKRSEDLIVSDFESKVLRAKSCLNHCLELKAQGLEPDCIFAHHGWGESLFLKEVWPKAKFGLYCEFFYHSKGFDSDFDPELQTNDLSQRIKIQCKNANNYLHFPLADAALSPTKWQADSFPNPFREKISIIHDGIDSRNLNPRKNVSLTLNSSENFTQDSQVLTYVSRDLDPFRGFHTFLRSLPALLEYSTQLRVLIVGGDGTGYGARHPSGKSWKDIFVGEVFPLLTESQKERVFFLGKIPYEQYLTVLRVSTVHVYFTYPFILSWSFLESMSIGCPIVASNTDPVKEIVEDGHHGLLTDFFDHKKLSSKIIELLDSPSLRSKLSKNARNLIMQKYDLNSVCIPKQISWLDDLMTS